MDTVSHIDELVPGIFLLLTVLALYAQAVMVAHLRHHHQRLAITVLTLLVGWTGLGWVVGLVWACTRADQGDENEKCTRVVREHKSCIPGSRGCGRQTRILLCCHSLIPGVINPHGLTNDPMILLDAMDFQNRRIVHGEVDKRHWPKEGKDHGRCRRGRRAFIAGDVRLMIAEIESDLPLDNGVDE